MISYWVPALSIPAGDSAVGVFHPVQPLGGSSVQTEDERPPQQVIPQSTIGPPDSQALLHDGAVSRLLLGQLPADVDHQAVGPLHPIYTITG